MILSTEGKREALETGFNTNKGIGSATLCVYTFRVWMEYGGELLVISHWHLSALMVSHTYLLHKELKTKYFGLYSTFSFLFVSGRVNAGERYVLVYQYLNWTEAQRYCREHYTDLVSVRNESESQKIRLLLYKYNYSRSVWIGLYTTRSWSDKSNSSFSNWYPGQPDNSGQDEYCTAVLTESGKWADENCGQDFPFFCYSCELISVL